MKKYFIIAAAAVVAMAACSKDQIVDNGPGSRVTFQTANYARATKAGDPVSVLNDFTSFKCKAFLHAEGVDLDENGDVLTTTTFQQFFGADGETISPNNTTAPTEWAPSHDYYWPKGTQSFVNFVGWYGTTNGTAHNSTPTVTYEYDSTESAYKATMEWSFSNATAGAAGANLLYADMAWRYKENDDTPQYGVSTAVTEGVPMLFHHALAQINVKAYATGTNLSVSSNNITDGTATWTLQLKNVKITPIYTGGTLTLTNVDPGTNTTQAWSGDWAGSGSAGDFTTADVYVNKVAKPAAAGTDGDVYAKTCVLPQDLTDVNLSFDLDIQVAYTNPAATHHEILHKDILLSSMGTTEWEMNTKYTYYLNIIPSQNEVLFDPALEADWVDGSPADPTEI